MLILIPGQEHSLLLPYLILIAFGIAIRTFLVLDSTLLCTTSMSSPGIGFGVRRSVGKLVKRLVETVFQFVESFHRGIVGDAI